MRRTLAIALAALTAGLASPAPVALGQEQPGPRTPRPVPTLSVTGEGQVSVKPDLAIVRLGVTAQEKDAGAAQAKVNQSMQRIIDAIKQVQVPAEQIQTSGLSLHPVTNYPRPRADDEEPAEPRVVGYRAQTVITLRLRDLNCVGPAVDAGLNAGANTLQGISFGLQDDSRAKAEALTVAVRSAKVKADALASALGIELSQLLEVNEAGTHIMEPMYDAPAMEMAARQAMPPTQIEAGQVQVAANVTLRYRMAGPNVGRPEGDDARPPAR